MSQVFGAPSGVSRRVEGLSRTTRRLTPSVTANVRLSADGKAVELESAELLEDDGPAAGYSYKPNEEKLSASSHSLSFASFRAVTYR